MLKINNLQYFATVVPTPKNVALGEGVVYFNYDNSTTPPAGSNVLVGATRGGSTFSREGEIKSLEFDGKRGEVKGFRRKINGGASLTVNALEIVNAENLTKFYAGLQVDESNVDYDVITAKKQIDDTDYIDNVAFVGETLTGEEIVIIIKNALGDGAMELALEDKEEVVAEVQFTAHADATDIAQEAWEIRTPKQA
jgi:hypothetical protein